MWRIDSKELRRRRIEKMLEQVTLGHRAKISERRVRALEANNPRVTAMTVRSLAKELGCEPTDIARPEARGEQPIVAGRPAIATAKNGAAHVATRPKMSELRAIERTMPAPREIEHEGQRVPKLTVLVYQQIFTAYLAHVGELYWIEGVVSDDRGLPPAEAALLGGRSGEAARFEVRCPIGRDGAEVVMTAHTASMPMTRAMQKRAERTVRFIVRVVAPKDLAPGAGLASFARERPSPWGLVVERVFDEVEAEDRPARRSKQARR